MNVATYASATGHIFQPGPTHADILCRACKIVFRRSWIALIGIQDLAKEGVCIGRASQDEDIDWALLMPDDEPVVPRCTCGTGMSYAPEHHALYCDLRASL